jgi:hypothetical protein
VDSPAVIIACVVALHTMHTDRILSLWVPVVCCVSCLHCCAPGPLPMSKSWTASLELPLCMLGVLLPRDFSR